MYQASDKTLNFILNDQNVAKALNAPTPIIPAVDIHGNIVQVSLTGEIISIYIYYNNLS